jgi:MtN3 and saliva related transmembrane protein
MNAMATQIVGWLSAATLLATLIVQIVSQWRDRSSKGVSPWLFVGQLVASLGFIVYSALSHNLVFIVTNSIIAAVAVVGQYTYFRNRRAGRQQFKPSPNYEKQGAS